MRFTDLDVSAAIWVETGIQPCVFLEPGKSLVTIEFPTDEKIQDVICSYTTGDLRQSVKTFAARRMQLYRLCREVKR